MLMLVESQYALTKKRKRKREKKRKEKEKKSMGSPAASPGLGA